MPFFYSENMLVYFAHVPKAAGSTIENYISEQYGEVFLLNRKWAGITKKYPELGRVSPQHLTFEAARQYMPRGPDWSFALVRNPFDRIFSEYRMHQSAKRTRRHLVKLGQEFHVNLLLSAMSIDRQVFDNHIRPQTELVPLDAEIYKLEDGVQNALRLVNVRTKKEANVVQVNPMYMHKQEPEAPSQRLASRIRKVYCDDFDRFQYLRLYESRKTKISDILAAFLAASLAWIIVFLDRRGRL